MKLLVKGLVACLLFSCLNVAFAAPANPELIQRLDEKITYRSEGQSIDIQLKNFSKTVNVYLDIHSNAKESLKLKTKKFTYTNVRAKYIFYRLLKEAGLKYKFNGNTVSIYKE